MVHYIILPYTDISVYIKYSDGDEIKQRIDGFILFIRNVILLFSLTDSTSIFSYLGLDTGTQVPLGTVTFYRNTIILLFHKELLLNCTSSFTNNVSFFSRLRYTCNISKLQPRHAT